MKWDEIMREGARSLIYDHPERLERIILTEMLKISSQGKIPTWGHYKLTHHWTIVQKYLNPEEQFHFRKKWRDTLNLTFPKSEP